MPDDRLESHDPREHTSRAGGARALEVPIADFADVDADAGAGEERRRPATGRRAVDRRVMAVVEWMSDAFLALDGDWRVLYANQEAARLNDTTPEALEGRSHWELWPETVGSEVEQRYREAVRTGRPVQFEHHYRESNVWHDVRAYPSDDGLAVFYRDISAQKALEAERARQARELAAAHEQTMAAELQFRLLVDRVRDYAVFLMDPDGTITHWGAGAERVMGYAQHEIVGRHKRLLHPEHGAGDGSAEDHLRAAAEHGEYTGEGSRRRRSGELFPARVVLTALRRGGELVGFSEITQDLTSEREREAAVHRAMLAAESANLAKSQFLANTSHEIRTPLNAVIGYAELLDMELAGTLSPVERQYVGRIQSAGRHLLTIVNDVLDLSKIESGAMRTARDVCLIRDAVAMATLLVDPQRLSRRLRLVNGCTTDAAYRGDAERVRQILVNLLSNAVRFTDEGGQVTISCGTAPAAPAGASVAHDGPFTFVRVEDTGLGIPPDEIDRIWEAFVQVDARHTRRYGGSGLGLTISRHLARLMDGDLTVRSTPEMGSSFVLWLPAADPAEVRPARTTPRPAAAIAADVTPADATPAAPPAAEPATAAAVADRALAAVAFADAEQMHDISEALLSEIERVLAMYVARLRVDPETPSAHGLDESLTEDHLVTFLADLATCVASAGTSDAQASLRDGTEIQRLIAHRHGLQRARLGWRVEEVRREFQVLREELRLAVQRRVTRGAAAQVSRALELLDQLMDHAEQESLQGYESGVAREAGGGNGEAGRRET